MKKVVIGLLLASVLGLLWGLDSRSWSSGLAASIVITQSLTLYEWLCSRYVGAIWEYKARKVGCSEPEIHCTSDNWIAINKWRKVHMAQYPELIFTPIQRIKSNDLT